MLVRMMPQFNYDNRNDYVIDRALPYVRWIFLGEEEKEERERKRKTERDRERVRFARLGEARERERVEGGQRSPANHCYRPTEALLVIQWSSFAI